jgi:hypothetical protein
MAGVSQATLDLINKAEADVAVVQGDMITVTGDQAAVSGAQATLNTDQLKLQSDQTTLATDAAAALNALASELGQSITVVVPPPQGPAPTNPSVIRMQKVLLGVPHVARAHALGMPWPTILQLLQNLPVLIQEIQKILGMLPPLPTGTSTP